MTYSNMVIAENIGAIEMKNGSLNGGEDGEHTGVGFVAISKIFVMQDELRNDII